MVDNKLVDKILEQGQKLRASMIESILKHDPFNTDILIYNKHFNTPLSSRTDMSKNIKFKDHHSSCSAADEKLLEAFIKGECMTKEEEQLALDTLRSLSAPELCHTTARSLRSQIEPCHCTTCQIYNSYLKSDNKHRHKNNLNDETPIITSHRPENHNLHLLEYVNSLKLLINNLKLTDRGIQKVLTDCKDKMPLLNTNFFVEYQIPEQIVSINSQNKSFSQNHMRLCSKLCGNSVCFKHISVHDIKSLAVVDLQQINVEFTICYRCPKQKSSFILGYTKFNFGTFIESKDLTYHKNLSVILNDKTPIIVGTLKLSCHLGCDRLYFGQDLVDAIKLSQLEEDTSCKSGSSSSSLTTKVVRVPPLELTKPVLKEEVPKTEKKSVRLEKSVAPTKDVGVEVPEKQYLNKDTQTSRSPVREVDYRIKDDYAKLIRNNFAPPISIDDSQVLLGFIYISEAQFSTRPVNTYLICQLFSEKELSAESPVIFNSSFPVYNFSQLVPILLNNDLLYSFRENYMLIEFWKLEESRRSLIGLARVSLHQFYLAFRNYVITQHLLKKELPVIGSDGFVTIYSPNSDKVIGQVEILAAIGLEEQINTLKLKRGFSSVKPKLLSFAADIRQKSDLLSSKSGTPRLVESTENLKQKEPLCLNQKYHGKGFDSNKVYQSSRNKDNSNILDFSGRQHKSPEEFKLGKVANKKSSTDVGTQSEMDEKKDNGPSSQDMLGSFLNHLIDQRQRNVCVENSTNTEPLHIDVGTSGSIDNARQRTNVELRKTSDLLDMLQNALATDKKENKEKEIDTSQAKVKAKVSILSANHLPSRKKAKPRKSKNRSSRNEDVSPSCYVTFESLVNSELYTTPVVSKGTSPVWNYTREVFLSSDFLTNGQKRLIFKVWRKSTNAVTSPNMQTDVVLGFAAVDLTVLLAGFPNIQGWFNIMDFSGKCNGQINIHIMPLEDLSKYCSNANAAKETKINDNVQTVQPPDQQEPSELLSRALKRKFVELDEITQRLRLRLSKVTNESDSSNDEMAEEFENDINALCIEDDFDTINFEDEAQKIQNTIQAEKKVENSGVSLLMEDEDGKGTSNYCNLMSCSENSLIKSDNPASSISLSEADNDVTGNSNSDQSINKDVSERERKKPKHTLDQQLQEGKQHINSLLEKLTLLSSGTLTSRYVSGCSTSGTNLDTEAMLEKLDHSSRPNIQSSLGFDPEKFEHLYGDVLIPSGQTSSSSLITEITGRRPAPDGEGGSSNSNSVSTSTLPSNNQK